MLQIPPEYATPATLLFFLGAVSCLSLYLHRLYVDRQYISRLRVCLRRNWGSYLETLSDNLARLKALRAFLARVRPRPEEAELCEMTDKLYKAIRNEIEVIDGQLEAMSIAPDERWFSTPVEWVPPMALQKDVQQLITMLQGAISLSDLERLKREWMAECELRLAEERVRERAELEERTRELKQAREEMEEFKRETASRALDAASMAAEKMAELADNLTLEEIEAKLKSIEVESNSIEMHLHESPDDMDLQGELKWAKQIRRWWIIQRRARTVSQKLDTTEDDLKRMKEEYEIERLETMQEFQRVEAESAENRKRADDTQTQNRHLTAQLASFEAESATVEDLQAQLASEKVARVSAEREMNNLESMLKQVEHDLNTLRSETADIKELRQKAGEFDQLGGKNMVPEREIVELQVEYDKLNAEVMKMKAAAKRADEQEDRLKVKLTQARNEYQEVLGKYMELEQTAKVADESMVPEKEIIDLQMAYDRLNSDLAHAKSTIKQAERAEERARERMAEMRADLEAKLTRAQNEHQSVLGKYMELESKIKIAERDMVPQCDMMDLQNSYDTLQRDMNRANAALKMAEKARHAESRDRDQVAAGRDGLEGKLKKTQNEHQELLARYMELEASVKLRDNEEMVPEKEVIELQTSFDSLQQEMNFSRAAVKRLEAAEVKAKQETEQIRAEHQDLVNKYRQLRMEVDG